MITPHEIEAMILMAMPGSNVKVSDMTGTGDHFEIQVVSKDFQGLTLIEQHKKVFTILEKEMDKRIHAVKLRTRYE